jgi:tetratricopeptide (TPR) repeat protein
MKKYLIAIIFLSLLVFSPLVSAETKTFIKEYSYQASQADSMLSSRSTALEQVKRLLLEELGTYLESTTEVKNSQLTKDEIITLTGGVVKTEIVEEKWDGKIYFLKVKMMVDPDDVYNSIDRFRQDREKGMELEEIKGEIEKLKKEKDYKEIEVYSNIIKTDPTSSKAYSNRGVAYIKFGEWQKAIDDFDKARELGPAGKLEPKAGWYFYHGIAYNGLKNYQQAIKDFDKAIEMEPNVGAYFNRGLAYVFIKNYQQAINDFNKAIEINPNATPCYFGRGYAYALLGDYHQAISDYDRAIKLDPKFALVYFYRGYDHYKLGNHDKGIEDIKVAARLGFKKAQEFLKSKGISW